MIRLAVALLLLALPAEAGLSQISASNDAAKWDKRIVATDGDSLLIVETGERIRLLGVDTAELKARCQAELDLALAAKRFTAEQLARGPVTITRPRLDKYGRTLAVVRINGEDLARLLIGAKLGRPYAGGRREGWC